MGCILRVILSFFAVFIFPWLLGVWEWFLSGTSGDTNEIGGSYWDHLNYGGLLLFPSWFCFCIKKGD
jgi:hypothetical protein